MFPREIHAIFFDAVGTLIHPEPPAPSIYADVARRHGSRHGADSIATRFSAAFRHEEEIDRAAGWRTSEERELQRWRTIVGQVLDDLGEPEACFQELYAHFSRPEAWRCSSEVRSVLQALAGKGYQLGLASNYDRRLRPVWEGLPELHACRHLVISSEVGWRKPASQFFDALMRQVNLPPSQILYVGDDPANDYEGATAVGMPAILLDERIKRTSFAGRRIVQMSEMLEQLPVWDTSK